MARPRKAKPPPPPSPPKAASPSLSEALLLATVCMVGLPVEVQVRDGSAYAGVLHTACVDDGYGVVLKKAKKIANGKGDGNLSLGAFVDTLVVHPDDLVQVIAKGLTLPIVGRTPDCNVVAASGSLKPQTSHANDTKMSKTGNIFPLEQVEKCTVAGKEKNATVNKNGQISGNATGVSPSPGHVGPYLSMNGVSGSATLGPKGDVVTSSVIPAPMVTSDVKASQPANNSATKIVTSSKTNAKEFKLNPCAKVFSPSFASSRQAHAAASPVNSNYISHSAPEVPTGIPVYEPKSAPGISSLSNKIHCSNLSPANYAISPQYVQSDAIHGTPIGSQGWPRPVMLNSYQASMQKFQGNAPVYLAPQVMATGNLPLVVPSPAPLVQPFQAIHPIMVPAASSMVPGKYM
ncbi:uncharacterized protein C2845_PM15G22760 [Panicum miliaceum]|uniref:Ataxin 2 SM domain-containing protein n=1 Tax=Panicum miliaceum TaxID=4540 RepID=A0A3L6Q4J8_PANMI|nr:uncharacterized protein C2845_PM15G22760 [Panicum miliaceum]